MDYLVQLNRTRAADDPLFWRQDTGPNYFFNVGLHVFLVRT